MMRIIMRMDLNNIFNLIWFVVKLYIKYIHSSKVRLAGLIIWNRNNNSFEKTTLINGIVAFKIYKDVGW